MSSRVLLVGYGRIGREVFADYSVAFADDELMVTDLNVNLIPPGYEWDGDPVNVAVVMVDTPAAEDAATFDYAALVGALYEFGPIAEFVLVRSTVSLDFLDLDVYRSNAQQIGYSPEFYGTSRHSRRGELDLGFTIFTDNVPEWFALRACVGKRLMAPWREAIVAKLAENAFLATKVTFFHELYLACEQLGVDFDAVREMVTSDPRITPYHSFCDGQLIGWQSHCFDKDVRAFVGLDPDDGLWLVDAATWINHGMLLPLRLDGR